MVDGVLHHLMDIVDPDANFTLADFKEKAIKAIDDILHREKLPIIVGGTGLYIQSIVDNLEIPKIAPNNELRAELEKKTLDEQVAMLKKIDPESVETIDIKNPRRVLRALEVTIASGESFAKQQKKGVLLYDALQIGIEWPREELYERINARVDAQMADGLLEETKVLSAKYDWFLPSMSGIGYKQMGYFLRGEMSLSEAIEILKRDTRRYSKRQMTWFKRDSRIVWVKNIADAEKEIKKFIK
jgi:tRNA dimethylallyltransferase